MRIYRLITFFLCHFFLLTLGFAQDNKEEANKLYKQAVKTFKAKNYPLADSLFSASLQLEKHPDAYYSRAVCRNYLGDHCGYCNDLNAAAQMGDKESKKQMQKDCVTKDSLFVAGESILKELTSQRLKKVLRRTGCLNFNEVSYSNDSNRVVLAYEYFDEGDTLFSMCEQIPSYIGGTKAMYEYLRMNIQYPARARIEGLTGTAYIQFKVLSNGVAMEYEILKGVKGCLECDLEAARVIRSIGHWYPARHKGRAVSVRMIIPVRFRIQ